jgi:two-component system chemotaxis sensor kinase CheA
MEEIELTLSKIIEDLTVRLIMVEPDDLTSLGSIIKKLEEISIISKENGIECFETIIAILIRIVEKIILKECENPMEGIKLIEEGVKLIKSKTEQSKLDPILEDEKRWIEKGKLWLGEAVENSKRINGSPAESSTGDSVPIDQDIEIYQDFISEALEHLGTIELNIINLEQSPENKEFINSIFRPFHTIKGVSGFLNLQQIHQFSHAMETLLDKARSGELKIRQEIIDFILDAVDLLRRMILDLKKQVESGKLTPIYYDIQSYLTKIESFEKEEVIFPDSKKLENSSEILPEEENLPLGQILSSKGIVSEEDIQKALKKQKEDKSNLKIGEILISENKAGPREIVEALREQRQMASQKEDLAIKVDIKKLDNLIDMVGELVIALSLVQQNPALAKIKDQKLIQDFSNLKRITNDLQRISMSLRMVPIRQTFQKMHRLVRDQSKKLGKRVDLHLFGEETEIDRNMVESLYEPLVHMIRNAIDHGIEPSEKRKAIGKGEVGNITLKAYQQGGNIVIEIEDDGQGLNRAKILQKAKEKGLISEENQFIGHQIDHLIFEPGFSTAEIVSDVSGRGVGMDVVKKAIDKLKGKIEIFSKEGVGTRFIIRIPLTLAIMDGIVVQVGDERFVIPTEFVKEAIRPRQEEIFTIQRKGELVKVRDQFIPLIKLYQVLGILSGKTHPWEALIIVVERNGSQKGLMVDDLLGKQEIVIKNLGEKFKQLKGVAGATIMGNGRVGLILDIQGIFEGEWNASSIIQPPINKIRGITEIRLTA